MNDTEQVHQPVVICGTVEASCRCVEPVGHTSPHVCACGGSWSARPDGDINIHVQPGTDWGYRW